MSEIPVNLSELEAKMAKALLEINNTIYAKGALIGSDNYFKIRGIAATYSMIYVDQAIYKKKNGRKLYCHMFADTLEELHAFAEKIGRKRCWFHKSANGYLHYDLDESFRTLAIQAGAIEIDTKDVIMARKLSKSIAEYLESNGWSSKLFLEHAKYCFDKIGDKVEVGRSVIYIHGDQMIKAYVHCNGRSNEWVTFTDPYGAELETVHYSVTPEEFLQTIERLIKI